MCKKALISVLILGSGLLGMSAWACPEPKVNKWDYEHVHCLQDGLALFKPRGQAYGYMNQNGDVVIRPQFEMGRGFREGLAAVKINGKWGYIDANGRIVISPQFESADNFYNGVANVRKVGDTKQTKINKQGHEQGKSGGDSGWTNPNGAYVEPVERPTIIHRPGTTERPTREYFNHNQRPSREIYR